MKKLTHINLTILLFAIFFLSNCKSKEQNIAPYSSEALTENYLTSKLSIKDFSFSKSLIKVPVGYIPEEDFIILTLPEEFKGDFITPTINLTDKATQISPKSGEKVFFDGKRPVEYTVTKKDGQTVKFNLYVIRQDKLDIEVFTKEIKLKSRESTYIQFKIKNLGTNGSPLLVNAQHFNQSNYLTLKIFNSDNKLIFSKWTPVNGVDTTSVFISNESNRYEFLKNGSFTMSFSVNEDTLLGKARKSDIFSFKIANGEKAFISPFSTFEGAWLLNADNIIKGVNFDSKKKYEITFENEFLSSPISVSPKIIDENTLSVKFPDNIDTLQCWITLKEENKIVAETDGAIVLKQESFTKNCQFSTNYEKGWLYFLKKEQPFTFQRNQAFGAYYVVSYGRDVKEAYAKGVLKLINVDTKQDFILKGNFVGCIWDCSASYWSFSIPDNVPKGFYEVYGINPQVNANRYWRKLEVK